MTGFDAVVVAAGSGIRLGGGVPKALRLLAGRPLVWHAVRTLRQAGVERLIVVAAAEQLPAFRAALDDVELVPGGVERRHSVLAGLQRLASAGDPEPGERVVLVHDAARPLVPLEVVRRVWSAVQDGAAAVVPVVPVTDTVRQLGNDSQQDSVLLDRTRLRAVQTPQGFDLATLLDAHRANGHRAVTDDASLCEFAGHQVALVEGSAASIKITHPGDLAVAELLLAQAREAP